MNHAEEEYEGNELWAAPEVQLQCDSEEALIGCKADIWSLGMTLFQMLTGHIPHQEQLEAAAVDDSMSGWLGTRPAYMQLDAAGQEVASAGEEEHGLQIPSAPFAAADTTGMQRALWRLCWWCTHEEPACRPGADEVMAYCAALVRGSAT